MSLESLLNQLNTTPESVSFQQVIDTITETYSYEATAFTNGTVENAAGTNEGSCKIFAFAKLNSLTPEQTLHCFGDYYRVDVLQNPEGNDHGNIRNFMETGWGGVKFEGEALAIKS
ncbi:MAG: HopJ type III effector protein [Cellvibrionaceae bacterium]